MPMRVRCKVTLFQNDTMTLLKDCAIGSLVSFPGKRRKFRVRDHYKPYLESLDKMVDGRNYIEHPGTHVWDSSGRIRHTRGDREVIVHQN
jgi:hypothetical protein